MKKVVVIGGGASGIIASIFASTNNEVIVLERNSTPLKKLLLTGNGKCNYFNDNQDISNYNSSSCSELDKIINNTNIEKMLSFLENIGIESRIKNGYYYPYVNNSLCVKEALLKESELCGVKIINNYLVNDIRKENDKFIINNEIDADIVILSTGSKAYPNTGSDGIGYELLNKFNLNIVKVLPSLVQLIGNDNIYKDISGIRSEVRVGLYEDNKFIKEETGEIQFTNYGVSGICIFNLSGLVNKGLDKNKKEEIYINFLPNYNDVSKFLEERSKLKNRNIIEMLESIINYKLLRVILKKSKIDYLKYYDELNDIEKNNLINNLTKFKINIIDSKGYENSQVCSGGLSMKEININTMESLKIKNLYITGELLDVDGLCGGYNLTFAFISGIIAGSSC